MSASYGALQFFIIRGGGWSRRMGGVSPDPA